MTTGLLRAVGTIALLGLAGCATVIEGTTQTVQISSDPAGARCRVDRGGQLIGDVSTPGSVRLHKSQGDILVTCGKHGYQTTTIAQPSRFLATTFGNILVGGVVGAAVDSADGANFEYPERVYVALAPLVVTAPGVAAVSAGPEPLGSPVFPALADPVLADSSAAGAMPTPLQPSPTPPNPFR